MSTQKTDNLADTAMALHCEVITAVASLKALSRAALLGNSDQVLIEGLPGLLDGLAHRLKDAAERLDEAVLNNRAG